MHHVGNDGNRRAEDDGREEVGQVGDELTGRAADESRDHFERAEQDERQRRKDCEMRAIDRERGVDDLDGRAWTKQCVAHLLAPGMRVWGASKDV